MTERLGSMSNLFTFVGGARIIENAYEREAANAPISTLIPSAIELAVPADATPLFKVGDRVLMGQSLCSGASIFSSVSGKISELRYEDGRAVALVIENDGTDTPAPSLHPHQRKLTDTTPDEIIDIIKRAGICESEDGSSVARRVGSAIGGAKRLMINCTECEPFLAARYRSIMEHATDILNGTKILLRALGIAYADIMIEESRLDAIRVLEEAIGNNPLLRLRVTATKHPQGDRKLVINAVTGKELPARETSSQLGYVVFSAEVCADIFRAFSTGMPALTRLVTVAGDCILSPRVVSVRIGTRLSEIIEHCGGLDCEPAEILCGGAMRGHEIDPDLEYFVSASDTAYLFLSEEYIGTRRSSACLRCGKCVAACPMHLLPLYLARYAELGDIKKALAMGLKTCIECGTCTYNCPGGVEHVYHIRRAKDAANAERSMEG